VAGAARAIRSGDSPVAAFILASIIKGRQGITAVTALLVRAAKAPLSGSAGLNCQPIKSRMEIFAQHFRCARESRPSASLAFLSACNGLGLPLLFIQKSTIRYHQSSPGR
jgi:hypothetical protein